MVDNDLDNESDTENQGEIASNDEEVPSSKQDVTNKDEDNRHLPEEGIQIPPSRGRKVYVWIMIVAIILGGAIGLVKYQSDKARGELDQDIRDTQLLLASTIEDEQEERIASDIQLQEGLTNNITNLGSLLEKKIEETRNQLSNDINLTQVRLSAEISALSQQLALLDIIVQTHIDDATTVINRLNSSIRRNSDLLDNLTAKSQEDIQNLANIIDNSADTLLEEVGRRSLEVNNRITRELLTVAQNISELMEETMQLTTQTNSLDGSLQLLDRWTRSQMTSIRQSITNLDNSLSELIVNNTDRIISLSNSTQRELKTLNDTLTNQSQTIADIQANLTAVWIELAKKAGYWESIAELQNWLTNDTTDQQPWIPETHDCDDFAVELASNALDYNRLVYPIPILYDDVYFSTLYPGYYFTYYGNFDFIEFPNHYNWLVANHMVDLTYCKDVGWIIIEPQTDALAELGRHEL